MMIKTILVFFVLLLTAACSDISSEEGIIAELSVAPESLTFPSEGGTVTLTVASSESARAATYVNWCSVKPGPYNDDKTVFEVTATENSSEQERSTTIKIICTGRVGDVEVVQAGRESSSDQEPGPLPGPVPEPGCPAASVGLGWNLGNQMDAHNNGVAGETAWGNPKATQATFFKLREYGFTHVRIPVTWLGHIGKAPDYKIDVEWLDRVYEIVGYAEKAGLVAIVNIHHDGADSAHWLDIKTAAANPSVHQKIMDQIKAMWTQIAEKFKDKGDFLVFESMNEIHDGGWGWGANRSDGGKQYRCFNEWQQVFVDAVRAVGGCNATRYLGIPGYCTNTDLTIANLVLPEDKVENRLMVAVHCYDPYEYCLQADYSEWGHTGAAGKKAGWGDEDNLVSVFKKLYDKYVSKGIPVYMGEMGCVNRATEREQAFQQYYLEYYAKVARTYGIVPYLWDNGAKGSGTEKHAFIDHGNGTFCSDASRSAILAFMKGMFTEDSGYTLDTVYAGAPE